MIVIGPPFSDTPHDVNGAIRVRHFSAPFTASSRGRERFLRDSPPNFQRRNDRRRPAASPPTSPSCWRCCCAGRR
jgi:hypothetical protein